MRVYFITNRRDGCFYYRCLQPMIYNGWRGDLDSLRAERKSPEDSFREAMQSDIIVFHRPDCEKKLEAAKLLKKAGKKIVFDNDDTFRIKEGEVKLVEVLHSMQNVIDEFISISDLVTTSTEFLAGEYKSLNNNVKVIPSCVDQSDWSKPQRNVTNKVRIGIVGSTTCNKDFEHIEEVLEELNKDKKIQLVMFGLPAISKQTRVVVKLYQKEFEFWNKFNIEWHPFVEIADYFETLNNLQLDIMLVPRDENYFNKAKSNCKFLEASMLEIPMIAQGFSDGLSPYELEGKESGIIVIKDNKDWLKEIYRLVEDKYLRRSIGKKAKKYVLSKYTIQKNFKNWEMAYSDL